MRAKSLLLALGVVLCLAGAARAETTIVTTGRAAVVNGDLAEALARAKLNAMAQAIEQVTGVEIAARTVLKNELMVESNLYAFTDGGIRSYQVLSQEADRNPVKVTLLVTVTGRVIGPGDAPAGLLNQVMDHPKLMVIPLVNPAHLPAGAEAVESALIKRFNAEGFHLVDSVAARRLGDELVGVMDGEMINRKAARLASRYAADVVIWYRPAGASLGHDGYMEQAAFSVEARAIAVSTAQVLGAERVRLAGAHPDPAEAMALAGQAAGEEQAKLLSASILRWWMRYAMAGAPFEVHFRCGPRQEALAIRFCKELRLLPGVSGVSERSAGGGVTKLTVRFKGDMARLRERLYEALSRQAGFKGLYTSFGKGRLIVFSVL